MSFDGLHKKANKHVLRVFFSAFCHLSSTNEDRQLEITYYLDIHGHLIQKSVDVRQKLGDRLLTRIIQSFVQAIQLLDVGINNSILV